MKLEQSKVMCCLLVLILALVFRASEAAPPLVYCLTTRIVRVPGCYDALRAAVHRPRDIKGLTVECCRAVFATLPATCFLKINDELSLPMTTFRDICDAVVPSAAEPSS